MRRHGERRLGIAVPKAAARSYRRSGQRQLAVIDEDRSGTRPRSPRARPRRGRGSRRQRPRPAPRHSAPGRPRGTIAASGLDRDRKGPAHRRASSPVNAAIPAPPRPTYRSKSISACACGERRIAACSVPGRTGRSSAEPSLPANQRKILDPLHPIASRHGRGSMTAARSIASSPGTRMRLNAISGAPAAWSRRAPSWRRRRRGSTDRACEPWLSGTIDQIAVGLEARRHRPLDLGRDCGCRRPRRRRRRASGRNAPAKAPRMTFLPSPSWRFLDLARKGDSAWCRPATDARRARSGNLRRRCVSSVASRGMAPSSRCSSPPPTMVWKIASLRWVTAIDLASPGGWRARRNTAGIRRTAPPARARRAGSGLRSRSRPRPARGCRWSGTSPPAAAGLAARRRSPARRGRSARSPARRARSADRRRSTIAAVERLARLLGHAWKVKVWRGSTSTPSRFGPLSWQRWIETFCSPVLRIAHDHQAGGDVGAAVVLVMGRQRQQRGEIDPRAMHDLLRRRASRPPPRQRIARGILEAREHLGRRRRPSPRRSRRGSRPAPTRPASRGRRATEKPSPSRPPAAWRWPPARNAAPRRAGSPPAGRARRDGRASPAGWLPERSQWRARHLASLSESGIVGPLAGLGQAAIRARLLR